MSAYGNDCHFYYNSTCSKGDICAFRHCETAKSSQVTCTYWQQGICSKANCPYRHVELPPEPVVQRNRQAIPCYWENQPVGCNRLNCQYQHFKPRPAIQGGTPLQNQPLVSEGYLPDTTIPPPLFGQGPPVSQTIVPIPGAPIIQPVVVQFSDSEVESDKNSPVKNRSAFTVVTSSTKTQNTSTVSQIANTASQIPNTTSQIASTTSQIAGTSSLNTVVPQTQVKSSSVTKLDLDYFIGKPFNKTEKSPPRSPVRYHNSSPDRRSYGSRGSRYSSSRSPSPRDRSFSPRWRRSPSPRRSRSPRRRSPYLRDRSRSRSPRRFSPRRRSPSPRRRTPPRNQITRPQDQYLTSRRPVHERLNRDRDYSPASTSRGRQPVAVPSKKISLSKIKDKIDSDDDKIKVKSLEEIQRAKALLSMGLIELQSGKIVKIGEVNTYKEEDTAKKLDDEPNRKKKIVKKSSVKIKKTIEKPKPKLKPKPKVKKVVKKIEKKEEVKSDEENEENDDEDVEEKEEENLDDGDDLGEEPEIDIGEVTGEFDEEPESEEKEDSGEEEEGEEEEDVEEEDGEEEQEEQESESEPEIVRYTEDIRRAVRKEDVDSKFESIPKRKRKVIVDEKEKRSAAEVKVSVQSRLGRKLKSTEVKVTNTPKTKSNSKSSVKSRLSLKNDKSSENISSSKTGTSRVSGGIKSRLGIGAVTSSTKSDSVNLEPKKIVLKRTLETDKKDDKREEVKKRRWNKGSVKSRLGDSTSDTNISSSDLKKIVIVRNIDDDDNSKSGLESMEKKKKTKTTSQHNQSQVKSTLSRINKIIEDKKEKEQQGSDSGPRLKAWKKLSVWSSRVTDTIASTKPTKKESDMDLYDSSSNDSLLDEPVLSTKEPKLSRKGPKQERALYVPPGRKRTVTSYDDQDEVNVSPVKKYHIKEKAGKEIKEPETIKTYKETETIKTYSQIMEEKRKKLEKQREKKAKAEEKSKKKKISRIEVSDKENESMPNETKTVVESKPVSTMKVEVPVSKTTLLDTFSFSLPETRESQPHSDNQPQSDKVDSTVEHIELLSTLVTDNSNNKVDDSQEKSPTELTSDDNWLDFSKDDLDMTGCDTADDDDLLREIDELLA